MGIELVNVPTSLTESAELRLVDEIAEARRAAPEDKQYVNFVFFRVNPDWRKLGPDTKRVAKQEFRSVYESYRDRFLLFSYSLIGFDSKADLMFWRIGTSMDAIQDMTASLFRTLLGSYFETADNYLSVTKERVFTIGKIEDRTFVNAGEKKYHFVYPCMKEKGWFDKSVAERDALIEENFMIGRRFENIKIHLTHAFGFSDQEYIISFETDEPRDFLDMADELRQTPASKFTLRGMPIYTCRQRPLMECLDALG
jgi:chlorite dismutase